MTMQILAALSRVAGGRAVLQERIYVEAWYTTQVLSHSIAHRMT